MEEAERQTPDYSAVCFNPDYIGSWFGRFRFVPCFQPPYSFNPDYIGSWFGSYPSEPFQFRGNVSILIILEAGLEEVEKKAVEKIKKKFQS